MASGLARPSDLKTTPNKLQRKPRADSKNTLKVRRICVLYMYLHLMVMVMMKTKFVNALTFLFLNRFSSMTPQNLCVATTRFMT